MPRIFVSYRRIDSQERAHRIADWITQKYGKRNVFIDIDQIPGGADFAKVITSSIEDADVVLIIIGDKWVSEFNRRNPITDFVYIEVSHALRSDKLVIPVLLNQNIPLASASLPSPIGDINKLNYMYVRSGTDFHADMQRIQRVINQRFSSRQRFIYLAVIIIIAVVVGLFGILGINNANSVAVESTSTYTPTPTYTYTPSNTPSNIPKPTNTNTPTVNPTNTPEPSFTPTITTTPSQTFTPTIEPTVSPTHTATDLPTATSIPPTWTPIPTQIVSANASQSQFKPIVTQDPFTGHTKVFVPAGDFVDANGTTSDEFWIDVYEVTHNLFFEFILQNGWRSSSLDIYYDINTTSAGIIVENSTFVIQEGFENKPVNLVTLSGAMAYCDWVGGRIPTATEWQKAAIWNPSDSSTSLFPWGDFPDETATNLDSNTIVDVGSYPNGMSPVGAFDMVGNVAEWTSNTRGINRYFMGYSYVNTLRSADLSQLQQATDSYYSTSLGFRCVYDE